MNQFRNPNLHDKEERILDLTKTHYELDHDYVCERCGLKLILFPQAQTINPFSKGPCYICPQCHEITDTAFGHNMLHADDIKPINISPPTFAIVPEEKGGNEAYHQYADIDPEPEEEERLRNMGATIKDKRIESRRDY